MKQLMTGNEAVARGAYEAGLTFASAYPGTPSTEILENMVKYKDDLYCEWAPNEKVAIEAAIGASIAGARSMAAMKHVGVNVAADPLFTFAYTGVTGGFVLVSADDPGMHSSQNEQDNRNYATAARLLMLEPSNSQEAKDFMKLGLELSERFDTPVLLRMTTRVCHSKSLVELNDREEKEIVKYKKNIAKFVATPANGKVMRKNLIDRIKNMEAYSNTCEINKVEYNDTKVGVISSGVAYQYAREVFGDNTSYLKLGMTFPMPMDKIKEFASKVDKLYVVEEMDPYIENHLRMAGIDCIGKEIIPEMDELNTDIVRKAVFGTDAETIKSDMEAVVRPPSLCAGCPHRGFFYTLSKKKNVMITGDIGCYTLGSAPPLSAIDTCICMGGSISAGHGASKVFEREGIDTKVVSVIGDSTFFHTGINSLMDVVYNKGCNVSVILDNRITGMTGHQENPGTGFTLMGEEAAEVNIELLCQAIGMKKENIYVVNPLNLKETSDALDEALEKDEATVIIAKWPCILKKFTDQDKKDFDLSPKKCEIDQDKCTKCKLCMKTGCPAIQFGESIKIDAASCTGCGVCMQVCPFDAIKEV
ncbi:indolepyruvate ferredoxin oxidoreductase subunit alpha [Anaerovorax odorimutans]|uniref:indolepyruvate ferredoxin oxidoreductase subunit alpha n=1 Tax=Anaerovorax odorimutans TaxID=109327 RepID=UPI000419A163|nr:indolepyruvate ferredoxin oxidoreductase subunit alpha [Anaerovorax odorimutans]